MLGRSRSFGRHHEVGEVVERETAGQTSGRANPDWLRLGRDLWDHPLRPSASIGMLASTMVVAGGTLAGAANRETGHPWWAVPSVPLRPQADLLTALAVFYLGLVVLLWAWIDLRRTVHVADHSAVQVADHPAVQIGDQPAAQVADQPTEGISTARRLGLGSVVVVTLLWAVPFAVGPPLGSRDVYAYAAQGRAADVGVDVYRLGPAAMGADPTLAAVDPIYREAPVLYGPLFVALSAEVSSIGTGLVGVVFGFRALALVGLVLTSLGVWDIARRLGRDPTDAYVLAVANPLVLLHLVSGAHNESLMLAALVCGVAIGLRPRWRLVGIALCAVAAAIKVPGILGAVFLAWPWVMESPRWRQRIERSAVTAAVVFAIVASLGALTGWGWSWVDALMEAEPVDAYLSVTRVGAAITAGVTGIDPAAALDMARSLGMVIAGAGTSWLVLRQKHVEIPALAASLLLVAVLHPTTQPWYLTWGLMLWAAASAGAENRGFIAVTAVAAFAVLPVGPQAGVVLVEQYELSTLVVLSVMLITTVVAIVMRPPRRFRQA